MRARAERKAAERGARVEFREAMADALPYEDGSFDSVLSSLVFHHLGRDGIRAAAAEIVRVLKPGGEFHLADWSRPSDPVMSALSWQVRLLDGVETTRESFSGRVPDLLLGAGLSPAGGSERLRTAFGVLEVSSHAKRSGF
jgi:SAM-dependent methyltransferase